MPSQVIASSSAKCKLLRLTESRKISYLDNRSQCDIVCKNAPQEQNRSEAGFWQMRLAAHRPWPIRKWFNVDHKRRRRSNPGGAMEGSMISEWLITSEAAHCSVHFCRGDTSSCCDFSSHTGRLDVRRTLG